MAEQLDAIIIGTGQAGKPLAGALAEAGWKTAIVEKAERVGGTCVMTGCTPTKTMVASARVAYLARRAADYGVRTGEVAVDLAAVRTRKRTIVASWSADSRKGLERHETLELVMGHARFSGPAEVTVETHAGSTRVFTARHIFLNVGTRPGMPPIPGLADVGALDNETVMELGEVPDHLLVIGGGFVGLEFGQMFRRFGSRVTVLETQARFLPREDEDVAQAIRALLEEDGIEILLRIDASSGSRATGRTGGGVRDAPGRHADDHRLARAGGGRPDSEQRHARPREGGAGGKRARLHHGERAAGDQRARGLRARRRQRWAGLHPRLVRRLPDAQNEPAGGRTRHDHRAGWCRTPSSSIRSLDASASRRARRASRTTTCASPRCR